MISAHYNTITTFILENKIKMFSYFEYKYSSACFLFRHVHFWNKNQTLRYVKIPTTQSQTWKILLPKNTRADYENRIIWIFINTVDEDFCKLKTCQNITKFILKRRGIVILLLKVHIIWRSSKNSWILTFRIGV